MFDKEVKEAEACEQDDDAVEDAHPEDSPGAKYTPCATLFLRLVHEKRGVLQIHKASFVLKG